MSLEKVGVLVTGNQNTGQTQKTNFLSGPTIQPAKRLLSDGCLTVTPPPHFAQLLSPNLAPALPDSAGLRLLSPVNPIRKKLGVRSMKLTISVRVRCIAVFVENTHPI